MKSIREFIHLNSSQVKYYNFDDRPSKIFSGLEHCRETIVITEKGRGIDEIITSKYHRWYTKDRPQLFKDLRTTNWKIEGLEGIVPKIGTEAEKKIVEKLRRKANGKIIRNFLKDDGTRIWYHNAPQYWVHAHTDGNLPRLEYYESYSENANTGEKTPLNLRKRVVSSHYKPLTFDAEDSFVINGLLNSSLFYWWFVIWSDGRDLLAQHIESFPIDLDSFAIDLRERLEPLVAKLMRSYDENSNEKINVRSGGYVVRIIEIIPKMSKGIIDQIDDIFADHFGFSESEKNFIKNFDLEFRV